LTNGGMSTLPYSSLSSLSLPILAKRITGDVFVTTGMTEYWTLEDK
jgi:hypothetical protein